jgi:hypothetical protein
MRERRAAGILTWIIYRLLPHESPFAWLHYIAIEQDITKTTREQQFENDKINARLNFGT